MEGKRYSVFISSTFEDLRDERRAVQDTVIEAGDFPVQMEAFPASAEDAFDLIKSLLDKCDYYVLIIGGRYGSLANDGLSYTHKEFRYAVARGIPVLVMLQGNRGSISIDRAEATDEGRERLRGFIEEASTGRTRKTWTSPGELKAAVLSALVNAKQTRPRVGWVRGDAVASVDALEQLNEVRIENAKYREALGHVELDIPLPPLPPVNAELEVGILPHTAEGRFSKRRGSSASVKTTWLALFPLFFSNLRWGNDRYEGAYWIEHDASCVAIGSALAQELSKDDTADCFTITKGMFDKLTAYYREAGLLTPEDADTAFTALADKVARRHRIVGGGNATFKLIDGSVEITAVLRDPAPSGMDDDIPF